MESLNLVDEICKSEIVFLDTEIAHYRSSEKKRISTIQALYRKEDGEEKNIIFDVYDNEELLRIFIEKVIRCDRILKVFHNAKFDIRFLGGTCGHYECTLENAKKIAPSILPVENYKLFTLYTYFLVDSNNTREQEIEMAKKKEELQKNIEWSVRPLTSTMVEYALNDTVYLKTVYEGLVHVISTIPNNNEDPNFETLEQTDLEKQYERLKEQSKKIQKEFDIVKKLMIERISKDSSVSNKYEVRNITRRKKFIKASRLRDVNIDFDVFVKNLDCLGEKSVEDVFIKEEKYQVIYKQKKK